MKQEDKQQLIALLDEQILRARPAMLSASAKVVEWTIREVINRLEDCAAKINAKSDTTIKIEVEGGCVHDVTNLPEGWSWEVNDHDPV